MKTGEEGRCGRMRQAGGGVEERGVGRMMRARRGGGTRRQVLQVGEDDGRWKKSMEMA